MTTFYKNYTALCAQKKKSASAVAVEIGLSRTSPNGWKKGKMPSDINLQKLSSYFGVSVEELTEEQKEKPAPTEGNELTSYMLDVVHIMEKVDIDKQKQIREIILNAYKLMEE